MTTKREHFITTSGTIGRMLVRIDWHSPDGRWHMRNLSFNGQSPAGLEDIPKSHVDLLGSFAEKEDRPIHEHDYRRGFYGVPLSRQVAVEPVPASPEPTPAAEPLPEEPAHERVLVGV